MISRQISALQAENTALREALAYCMRIIENADMSNNICCCGDEMDQHSDPMNCGHSPVDSGDYYAAKCVELARTLLGHEE